MRLNFSFFLASGEFPLDYHSTILSYLKTCLSSYHKGEYYDKYYSSAAAKSYTFAVKLAGAKFNQDKISIPSKKINLFLSTADAEIALTFYNAIIAKMGRPFPLPYNNSMILTGFNIETVRVISQPVISCKMMMPLCVRVHNRSSNKDQYITYEQDIFQDALKLAVKAQIQHCSDLSDKMMNNFRFEPLQMKKTVVKHYGQNIAASLGTFKLYGDIRLLTYLYLAGISSRSSIGFGYFNIID